MYLAVLPLDAIATAKSDRVAVVAAQYIFGQAGTIIIAVMIMISTFACNNGLIMAGARVYYTMAKDGLFFKKAANLNKFDVPGWALWIQGIWASALCLTGRYGALLDFVVIIVLIFYIFNDLRYFYIKAEITKCGTSIQSLWISRTAFLYLIIATALCIALLIYKTSTCGWGVGIMLAGIPVYYFTTRKEVAA